MADELLQIKATRRLCVTVVSKGNVHLCSWMCQILRHRKQCLLAVLAWQELFSPEKSPDSRNVP